MTCGRHFLDLDRNRLLVAFGITFLMMAVEFAGGLISGSIALVSDAAHMLVDTLALGCSALAAHLAAKEGAKKIGGCYVGELHAALTNGVILAGIAVFIIYSAYQRFLNPREVQSVLMLAVAVIGLAVNLFGIFLLRHGSHENINVRGAFLHIVSDTLSSAGVIFGGVIIYYTGWYLVDAILGFMIALMILRGGIGLIREAAGILLGRKKGSAAAPAAEDLGTAKEIMQKYRDALMSMPNVCGVGVERSPCSGTTAGKFRLVILAKEDADLMRKLFAEEIEGLELEVVEIGKTADFK